MCFSNTKFPIQLFHILLTTKQNHLEGPGGTGHFRTAAASGSSAHCGRLLSGTGHFRTAAASGSSAHCGGLLSGKRTSAPPLEREGEKQASKTNLINVSEVAYEPN